MSRRFSKSQAAKEAVLPIPNPVDDISQGLSDFNLTHPVDVDVRRLWFIPSTLQLPDRVQKGPKHSRRRPASHIPRPRNKFFLFKSLFMAQKVLPANVSFLQNSCQVCRITSYVWGALPESDRARFHEFDEEEKRAHKERHPEYDWTPGKVKKITLSTSTLPSDEIDMTPEEIACKRIAELVLKNLQGAELANRIQDVLKATISAGWSDTATLSSKRKAARKSSKTASRALARQMRKSVKNSQLPKVRSSYSKSNQSKALLDSTYAGLMNRPRRQTAVCYSEETSDDEEEVMSDNDGQYCSSQCSMPPSSLTSEDVSMASTDNSAAIRTPSRFSSPSIVGGAMEDPFDWAKDGAIHQPAFDRASSFEPFEDNYGSVSECPYSPLNNRFPSGLQAHHAAQYSDSGVENTIYPEIRLDPTNYAEVQMALLTQDLMDIQPTTISPALLHI